LLASLATTWQPHALGYGCQGSAVIYKRGKSWRVIVYIGRDPMTGKQLRKGGSAPTRAEAKLLEARLVTEAAAGQHRGDRKRTVAELLDRWFEWRQGVRPISPRTVDNYRRDMDWFILPVLGKLPVTRLDASTLDRFYAQLRKQGGKNSRPLAPSTVREVHAILSGALQRATAWGWITQNPARLASPPVVEKAKVRPPELGQVAELLRVAMQEDLAFGLFLRLAVVLGARRGELCALRWSHINFDSGEIQVAGSVIYVPGQPLIEKDTKTHAERRVAVGADTLEALRTHRIRAAKTALASGVTLGPNAYVFSHTPDGQAPIRPDYMTHRFTVLAKRLNVTCRLHDLRHFMVTQLVAGGVDWRTVAGRAGHADGHMTLGTYAHFQQAQDRKAAEFMDRLLVAPGTYSR
jgi:integrase